MEPRVELELDIETLAEVIVLNWFRLLSRLDARLLSDLTFVFVVVYGLYRAINALRKSAPARRVRTYPASASTNTRFVEYVTDTGIVRGILLHTAEGRYVIPLSKQKTHDTDINITISSYNRQGTYQTLYIANLAGAQLLSDTSVINELNGTVEEEARLMQAFKEYLSKEKVFRDEIREYSASPLASWARIGFYTTFGSNGMDDSAETLSAKTLANLDQAIEVITKHLPAKKQQLLDLKLAFEQGDHDRLFEAVSLADDIGQQLFAGAQIYSKVEANNLYHWLRTNRLNGKLKKFQGLAFVIPTCVNASKNQPEFSEVYLNRHEMIHGSAKHYCTRENFIRLFNILCAMAELKKQVDATN